MTQKLEMYKCNSCGNIVQVIIEGQGDLVCCNHLMELVEPKTVEDEFNEKHIPIMKDSKIYIGEVEHPMADSHYIQFVETVSKDNNNVKLYFLHPNEKPEIEVCGDENIMSILSQCNIHGTWRKEINI